MLYRIPKTTYDVVGQKPTISYTISYIKTYDIEKTYDIVGKTYDIVGF
jgi:hypothetical protein